MRLVLLLSDVACTFDHEIEHVGVMALSASVKRAGHEVVFRSFRALPERTEYQAWLKEQHADLIAVSTVTNQWPHAKLLCRWAKESLPGTPVLVGGYHATLAPDEVIGCEWVDLCCRGEGDEALVELCDAIEAGRDFTAIANFWVKTTRGVTENPLRPLLSDLDTLPFLDFEIYDVPRILRENQGLLHFQAGRGCPYPCTYCSLPAVNEMQKGLGSIVRKFSPGRVAEEIARAKRRYPGFRAVSFVDETFTVDKRWTFAFVEAYREVAVPFEFMTSAKCVNPELYAALASVGADLVRIGVESGNEWLRNEVLKRGQKDHQLREAFAWAEAAGIRQGAFAMVGLPHETPEMAEQTRRFLEELQPDEFWLTIFHPFPRTGLYNECKRQGWLAEHSDASYFGRSILKMPQFSAEAITRAHKCLVATCTRGAARKRPMGRFDLLVHLDDAQLMGKFPPDKGGEEGSFAADLESPLAEPDFLSASYPGRFWLRQQPGSELRYRVPGGETLWLDAAIGIDHVEADRDLGGVIFEVLVGGTLRFSRTLDPARRAADRDWFPVCVPLTAPEGLGDGEDLPLCLRLRFAEPEKAARVMAGVEVRQSEVRDRHYRAGWGRPHLRAPDDPSFHREAWERYGKTRPQAVGSRQ